MLTRALIVVLAVLNLGVACWWLLRDAPQKPAPPPQPAGVAELRWVPGGADANAAAEATAAAPTAPLMEREPAAKTAVAATPAPAPAVLAKPEIPKPQTADATPVAAAAKPATPPAPVPAPEKPVTPPAAAEPPRCVALGPFADRAAATGAQGKAGTLLSQVRLREQPAASGSARYRVMLPAAANRDEAQATVKRIVAAGLSDYYIISQGEEANAVALGQYRNREGAERRMAAVQAAGFQPRLVASGDAGQWWLEGQLAAGTQPAQAQQRSGAAQSRSLECTRLR
ncbi:MULTISPECIES: SPOR domain-containing protein [Stenotrophomonas]|jgi:cell division protein FtsN|uniref:SPOR domain-containing protein n=1 Tax=Stenotrophomonas TaxID=40323 RepID=UPI000DA87827|nr:MULTISPECIES: SPOR domain-containing protein [Stenotrophomonas]MBH1512937.1 SPOR domain-containing protein [Stenotrophomonas maltophilia]MBH1547681.1 SPOR domain-containing protein [Stenotrophomonas maltophilia]MBH1862883.1 SPOR domain-containing protein [Stenotrophomonas maltophilia]MBN5064411.1 SPOR domain-containing protein [Stenotrophomonas maltophilia]MCU1033652.1 SPOR domain-containing protein [Stenotrophomonas maltophilia]